VTQSCTVDQRGAAEVAIRSHLPSNGKTCCKIRLAATAVGEIARIGLVIGGMTAVLWRHDDVEILRGHERAHRFPTPIALSSRKTRIRIKFGHSIPRT
jgi:hypothetical protein